MNIRCYCDQNLPMKANLKKNTKLLQRRVRWFRDKLVVVIATRGKLKKIKFNDENLLV